MYQRHVEESTCVWYIDDGSIELSSVSAMDLFTDTRLLLDNCLYPQNEIYCGYKVGNVV